MVTRYLISDSSQELAIVEFPDGNNKFPKTPVFRSMMNDSLIYYNSNKMREIENAKLKLKTRYKNIKPWGYIPADTAFRLIKTKHK